MERVRRQKRGLNLPKLQGLSCFGGNSSRRQLSELGECSFFVISSPFEPRARADYGYSRTHNEVGVVQNVFLKTIVYSSKLQSNHKVIGGMRTYIPTTSFLRGFEAVNDIGKGQTSQSVTSTQEY